MSPPSTLLPHAPRRTCAVAAPPSAPPRPCPPPAPSLPAPPARRPSSESRLRPFAGKVMLHTVLPWMDPCTATGCTPAVHTVRTQLQCACNTTPPHTEARTYVPGRIAHTYKHTQQTHRGAGFISLFITQTDADATCPHACEPTAALGPRSLPVPTGPARSLVRSRPHLSQQLHAAEGIGGGRRDH